MPTKPYTIILRCSLCKKEFRTRSLRSFTQTARRHREKDHPKHKGSLMYNARETT